VFGKGEAWNPTTGEKVPFYIMEYIDGLSLNECLKTIKPKKVIITFCDLLYQAADALITTHNRGITHGDIKSANLMVNKSSFILKLTEFSFGIPPGKNQQMSSNPNSSYYAPEGYSAEEAGLYRLGRTLKDCLNDLKKVK
jgi:serine/threonine protein kinase